MNANRFLVLADLPEDPAPVAAEEALAGDEAILADDENELDGLDAEDLEAVGLFDADLGDLEEEDHLDMDQAFRDGDAIPLDIHAVLPAPVAVAADEALAVANHLELAAADEALAVANHLEPAAADEALAVANHLEPAAADEDIPADDERPWVLVIDRRAHMNNGANRNVPSTPHEDAHGMVETENVCENEYPWYPKEGSVRDKQKWSRARRSGLTGTEYGLAYFTYAQDM